ncbi:hypothetical protein DFH05DRAFT_1400248 [Lentinula detonsa]|uniref:F-box domain-containing protein n=1 Tax=Lentinula detonsa TaxID=2804962 RepID=A0A9W8NZB3_9AGAR|nr:hypothetical protein DFH05DRAFT_1400248 [Lentinula detonsa]
MILPLPEDIFLTIFQYLGLEEVLSMRTVCKSFKDMTHLRGLWISILRKEVWARNIPTPRIDLDRLSATQIEKLVANALCLHRNWTSEYPRAVRRRHVMVATPGARITSLHFITLEGCSCLLSFSLTSRVEPRMMTVECWDMNSLRCKARRTMQWFGGYAVNSDPESTGVIAIKTPFVEVLAFDPSASSPESAFIPLITLNTAAKNILSLTGNTLFFRTMNNELKILDIVRPLYELKLEDRQPLLPPNQVISQVLHFAVVHNDYAIILRPKTLALYDLNAFRRGSHPPLVSLSPVQVHEFQWRIDSCVMQRQISPSAPHSSNEFKPCSVNILIRYSSLFPWPVNLLHHFILHPNHLYNSSTSGGRSSTATGFALTSNNLPYNFPPVLSRTIVSPVRLFAITDMALGSYGTAVWLDSHTDYHAEVGQRLAGLMLGFSKDKAETGGDNASAVEQSSTRASMVFGAHETDDWNRVAIDEGGGRTAVGSITGEIIIDDYIDRCIIHSQLV